MTNKDTTEALRGLSSLIVSMSQNLHPATLRMAEMMAEIMQDTSIKITIGQMLPNVLHKVCYHGLMQQVSVGTTYKVLVSHNNTHAIVARVKYQSGKEPWKILDQKTFPMGDLQRAMAYYYTVNGETLPESVHSDFIGDEMCHLIALS